MAVFRLASMLTVCAVMVCGCKKTSAGAPPEGASAGAATSALVKVNKYGYAVFCDVAAGANGALHAVFTDAPEYGKAPYLYYATSSDHGATWSDPKNLSDDESGFPVGFCKVAVDGKGRVYAIWKYVMDHGMEGPGGNGGGELCFRCLDGGTWSKTVRLNKLPHACFSYFVASDAHGSPNIVWSQPALDAVNQQYALVTPSIADLVNQATLDGGAMPAIRGVIVPDPILNEQQLRARNLPPDYAHLNPKHDGLYNLRGYIAPDGRPHFIGENVDDKSLRHFDGRTLTTIYTPNPAVYASFNTFMEPASLLVDAAGQEHVIRMPEKPEIPCIRDYLLSGTISDPVPAIQVKDAGTGTVFDFSAFQGPGGHMVVLCGLSETEKIMPKQEDLYAVASEGKQQWNAPTAITDNTHSGTSTAGNGAVTVTTYQPRFASMCFDAQGHACILFVSEESKAFGVNTVSVTAGGRAVQGMIGGSTGTSSVMFRRL
ncbi:MAG TPA: hypothetical protein VFE58_10165 [Tepidisphaeraceae bacterium]|jgi:hypothetical protein|nr:hypothetical protein [Tepidisphaeraceae bacterium]